MTSDILMDVTFKLAPSLAKKNLFQSLGFTLSMIYAWIYACIYHACMQQMKTDGITRQ